MALPQIVLASSSPFRRQLLEKIGIEFEAMSPDVDETPQDNEPPKELVARLALKKAQAVAQHYPSALIIASDQVAVLNQRIMGKPGNHDTAVKQLTEASGQQVLFLTSLILFNAQTQKYQCEVIPFRVYFRPLSAAQIQNYLEKEQPYNCAGSFKSEGLGIALFDKLEGEDPNTLIGLPLIRLIKMLAQKNVNVI